jgi:hypothetical protein
MRSTGRPKSRRSITPAQFRNFIFGGRSVFTLENSDTGNYITFRILQIKKRGKVVPDQFKVECKSLNDKAYGYQFLGFLDIAARTFRRWGRTPKDFIGYKTLFWLLQHMEVLENYNNLVIYHEGACATCGMPLTTPESIDNGIGPICRSRMLEKSIKLMKDMGVWNSSQSYEDNVRAALLADPSVWSRIHVPEEIKKEGQNKPHRLFERLGIF